MLTSASEFPSGLLNIIHEGKDSTDKYAPGSQERDMIRRFFVLCSHFKKDKTGATATEPPAAEPHATQPSHSQNNDQRTGTENSLTTAITLPDLSFTNFEVSTDQVPWLSNLWDNLFDYDMDQTNLENMDFFFND